MSEMSKTAKGIIYILIIPRLRMHAWGFGEQNSKCFKNSFSHSLCRYNVIHTNILDVR